MSEIHEEDILGAGKDQVIISNDNTKVIIVPELGGRIADVQTGEISFLHRTYPEGVNFGPYTEYGGIEECIGGAPGTLWSADWKWEQKDDGVLLQSLSKRVLVRKFITLDDAEPVIKIDYRFFNLGVTFSKFTFGIHPEVCIGGSLKDNQYHVPTGGELLNGGYVEPGFKSKLPPSEGWCAITHDGKVLGQMFPEGVIDVVELYYPKVNTHMVLEPIIFGVGVSPEKYAAFTYMIYMGDGDAEKVREMRASRGDELSMKYELFDRAEIPEELVAELEERAAQEAEGPGEFRPGPGFRPAFHPEIKIPRLPEIPNIPDVGAIIKKALENIPGQAFEKSLSKKGNAGASAPAAAVKASVGAASRSPETQGTGRTDDLPPDAEISIEHLKGNIIIHGWERAHVEYADLRGKVEQDEAGVRVEGSGDYWLRVPRDVKRINLNFVSGDASLFDVASSLKLSGVKGKINVVSAKVPDDGMLDISLVTGDINLTIPGDSSCRISATNLSSGQIGCDLPLQEEESSRAQLSGVLNDGKAEVKLSNVKGNISINQIQQDQKPNTEGEEQ